MMRNQWDKLYEIKFFQRKIEGIDFNQQRDEQIEVIGFTNERNAGRDEKEDEEDSISTEVIF